MSQSHLTIAEFEPTTAREPRVSGIAFAVLLHGAIVAAALFTFQHKFDVVFMDVRMPGIDGLELGKALQRFAEPPALVFVSAYEDGAVSVFEHGLQPLDYLMKPFDDARFRRALARAKEQLVHAHSARRSVERLVVKSRGRAIFLNVGEIDWMEADSYYACLHVGRDTHVLRRTLAELELDLDSRRFLRIHRSAIVNLRFVSQVVKGPNETAEVHLKGRPETLSVSRNHVHWFRQY